MSDFYGEVEAMAAAGRHLKAEQKKLEQKT